MCAPWSWGWEASGMLRMQCLQIAAPWLVTLTYHLKKPSGLLTDLLVIVSSTGLTSILILSTDLTDCMIPFPISVFFCFTQIPKKHNLLSFWLRNTWFICSSTWRWCCHDDKYHLRSRSHLFKQNTAACPFVLYLGGKNYFYFCLSYM